MTTSTLLAFVAGICLGLGTWSGARWLFGIDEAWDHFAYYLTCLLVGGLLGGMLFRVNYPFVFAGTLLGQIAYVLCLVAWTDKDASLLPLGMLLLVVLTSLVLVVGKLGSFLVRHYWTSDPTL